MGGGAKTSWGGQFSVPYQHMLSTYLGVVAKRGCRRRRPELRAVFQYTLRVIARFQLGGRLFEPGLEFRPNFLHQIFGPYFSHIGSLTVLA